MERVNSWSSGGLGRDEICTIALPPRQLGTTSACFFSVQVSGKYYQGALDEQLARRVLIFPLAASRSLQNLRGPTDAHHDS